MRASDLLESVDILKKIEAKEAEKEKITDKLQGEIDQLKASLPASVRAALSGENAGRAAKSSGERRERITLSNDDKAAIRTMAKEVMKGKKDGMKFSEIMTAVKKQLPDIDFKDTHFRGILQNDKAFSMKGTKINALWFVK